MQSGFRLSGLYLALLLLTTTGCRTSAALMEPSSASVETLKQQQLLEAAARWEGTPHRWGGLDHRGIDCSGLVVRIYQEVFGITLPRTTEAQARLGRPVALSELEAGDLVFFRLDPKNRHVGVYLGEGRFVHAASSTGVTRSRLDEPYWQRHYWMARRVLSSEPQTTTTPTQTPSIGW